MSEKIKIAGAGISGLTAAINLAKAGYSVEVFDRAKDSGLRFSGDFQGIENWSFKEDALDFLNKINIKTNFPYQAVNQVSIWGPKGLKRESKLLKPGFYLVKRGIERDCLDYNLKEQAKLVGVNIFYNHPITPSQVDIVATGPVFNDPNIDSFASGYTFNTDLENFYTLIFDEGCAPGGYSYFLVWNGYSVIATCVFGKCKKLKKYREKTLKLCQKYRKFTMENVKIFSGIGNFFLPKIPKDQKIFVGEAGGFQDFLAGFGMRYAFLTGYFAAESIINKQDFYKLCQKEIIPKMKTSVANRLLFKILGNRSYKYFIKIWTRTTDPLEFSYKIYNPSLLTRLIFPIANIIFRKYTRDPRFIS